MLDSEQIQIIRTTLRSLLAQFHYSYKPIPFDDELYQACVDEGIRRGYPMDGVHSVRRFLRLGAGYAMTSGAHLDRPAQIWLSFFTSCVAYVDEARPYGYPSEIPSFYLFHERLMRAQKQENVVLDALADIIRQIPDVFPPVPAKLIMTSCLNFITANLLECETVTMQIASVAQQYPVYYRAMSALAEGYAYMVFSRETPYIEYIQAIPEIMLLLGDLNDVLSFYKEELAGEDNNQISVIARRNKESHLGAFNTLAEVVIGHYNKIVKILEGSPDALEEFRCFAIRYIDFHVFVERYKLADLNLLESISDL